MTTIYENYVEGVTRLGETLEGCKDWIKAEENLGLNKTIWFFHNGNVTSWYDKEEAEEFYDLVKDIVSSSFEKTIEYYFEFLKEKNLVGQFECLAIFNEIDEHPEIATPDQLRRLKRVREETHEEAYK